MCRLFGFRSILSSQVHSSLLEAENALAIQSSDHPDGWGVAYYLQNIPHVVKSAKAALGDNIFKRVSGVVSSQTVLAHIRKTTVGRLNILNTHPFQFGPWVFAHNGHIVDFQKKKKDVKELICPQLQSYILGETDSEYIFYFILTRMQERFNLSSERFELSELLDVIHCSIDELINIVGEASKLHDQGTDANYFTFILTNGKTMLGHQRGKKLHYSTYKVECPERTSCHHFNESCENLTDKGRVNHLLLSSEPLSGENVWSELKFGQSVAVDADMTLLLK